MEATNHLKVRKLKTGTVIDHIPQGRGLLLVRILGLDNHDSTLLIATRLESRKIWRKDIIKVERRFLSEDEIKKIALIAPGATISIIDEYSVKKKIRPDLPELVKGIIRCPNPRCVTRTEGTSRFLLEDKEHIIYRCAYCETPIAGEDLVRIIEES